MCVEINTKYYCNADGGGAAEEVESSDKEAHPGGRGLFDHRCPRCRCCPRQHSHLCGPRNGDTQGTR